MEHSDKAKFILALHKHSLEAFDGGGVVGGGGPAGLLGNIAGTFTTQNSYTANEAPTDYTNYGPFVAGAGANALQGYATSQDILRQQQELADQLKARAAGNGPNPAQAALNEQTGKNVATQGALMAGQRGAASNVGLIARQAGQQGAATQQQATGQGATLEAQQEIAAQNELANVEAQMAQGNISEQGANATIYGTSAGAQNTQNANNIQNAAMAQGINSQVSQNNANAVNKTEGGLLQGVASGIGAAFGLAKGGFVGKDGKAIEMDDHLHSVAKIYHPHMYADGGNVGQVANVITPNIISPISSDSGTNPVQAGMDMYKKTKAMSDAEKKLGPIPNTDLSESDMGAQFSGSGFGLGEDAAGSAPSLVDTAPAASSAGLLGLDTGALMEAAPAAAALEKGGKVKAMNQSQKAVKKDNSYSNDKVPALLSEDEIVLPRSITMHKNAPEKAAEFVRATIAKRKMGKK